MQEGLSLDNFRNLEKCSISIHGLNRSIKSRRRLVLLDILEAAPAGFLCNLKSFKLSLLYLPHPLFDRIFDPEARGWSLARRLLGPKNSPSLEFFPATSRWSHDCDGAAHRSMDESVFKERVSVKALETLELCIPG